MGWPGAVQWFMFSAASINGLSWVVFRLCVTNIIIIMLPVKP
jgi:hypothetical protein